MNWDRTSEGFAAVARAQFPRDLYARVWSGAVVAQNGQAFDFQPDDPRLPSLSGIPLRLPFPGFTVAIDPTQTPRAVLAFANADPSMPELHLWEYPGMVSAVLSASQRISLVAPAVNLGGDPAAEPAVLGQSQLVALTMMLSVFQVAFSSLTPGPVTGGPVASFNAAAQAITAFLQANFLSSAVKVS